MKWRQRAIGDEGKHTMNPRQMASRVTMRLLVAALMASPTILWAQNSAPAAPTREEIQQIPRRSETRPAKLSVEGGIERAPCPLADERYKDISITLTGATFEHLAVVSPDLLKPAYADFLGKTVPISVVCEIRDAAATILRRAGYLAAVQVPPQRIESGVVRFDVLTAKLVGIRVRGKAGGAEAVIARYLSKLVGREVFNQFEAERYLLLAKDLPGYDVRLRLRSAATVPGEVIGEISVEKMPIAVDAYIQNYGSHDVGRFGGLVRAELHDLIGSGDRASIGFFGTSDLTEQKVLQLGYDMRLGGEGLTIGGNFTYAWTDPEAVDPQQGQVESRTLLASFEASYPFVRSQSRNIRGSTGLDFLDQKVDLAPVSGAPIRISRDHVRVAYARIEYDVVSARSVQNLDGYSAAEPRWRMSGTVELRKGLDILNASQSCGLAPNFLNCTATGKVGLSRVEGIPTAALIRANAYFEYRPAPALTLSFAPRAQYTDAPLVSFEEFSGGNYSIGRGYDPGAIIGDRGVGFQTEARYGHLIPQSRESLAFQPYVFLDQAWVWNLRDVDPTRKDPDLLTSIGGGVRVAYGSSVRLDILGAFPVRRTGSQTQLSPARLLVSLTTRLWPR